MLYKDSKKKLKIKSSLSSFKMIFGQAEQLLNFFWTQRNKLLFILTVVLIFCVNIRHAHWSPLHSQYYVTMLDSTFDKGESLVEPISTKSSHVNYRLISKVFVQCDPKTAAFFFNVWTTA